MIRVPTTNLARLRQIGFLPVTMLTDPGLEIIDPNTHVLAHSNRGQPAPRELVGIRDGNAEELCDLRDGQ